jgi:hypothetical protein
MKNLEITVIEYTNNLATTLGDIGVSPDHPRYDEALQLAMVEWVGHLKAYLVQCHPDATVWVQLLSGSGSDAATIDLRLVDIDSCDEMSDFVAEGEILYESDPCQAEALTAQLRREIKDAWATWDFVEIKTWLRYHPPCECGAIYKDRCAWEPTDGEDYETVYWIPESQRESDFIAGFPGIRYLPDWARHELRVSFDCAERILRSDPDWAMT